MRLKSGVLALCLVMSACSSVQRRPAQVDQGVTLKHTLPDGTRVRLVSHFDPITPDSATFSVTVSSERRGEELRQCTLSATFSEDRYRPETCVAKKLAGIGGTVNWQSEEVANLVGDGLDDCLAQKPVDKILLDALFDLVHDAGCSY